MEGNGHGDSGNGVKLGFNFSKTKAPQRKLTVAGEYGKDTDKRQLITGFEGGKAKTVGGAEEEAHGQQRYIIPKLENTYKTGVGKKFAPSFVPQASDAAVAKDANDRFEAAIQDTRPNVTGYGLEVRKRAAGEGSQPADQGQKGKPAMTPSQLEQLAYKEDMAALPDAPSEDAYEAMPIEEFGKAMLFGMGWTEGQRVGRRRKEGQEDVKASEYLRRPERLGLGAQAAALEPKKSNKVVKMGDKPEVRREDLVLAPSADGRTRHRRHLDEQLVHRAELAPGPRAGKMMCIVGGRHAGLKCEVLELLPEEPGRSSRASVLLPSHEKVDVRLKDLEDIHNPQAPNSMPPPAPPGSSKDPGRDGRSRVSRDDKEGHEGHADKRRHREGREGSQQEEENGAPPAKKARDSGRGSKDRGGGGVDDGRSRDGGSHHKSQRDYKEGRGGGSGSGSEEQDAPRAPSWLAPFIKVRVIDKHVRDGKLYLKKGTIMDVHPGKLCDVVMDDTRHSIQLRQRQLETVIPKEVGAAVLVVAGPLRGHKARLHAKSDKGACAVQLVSDYSIQRLMLDAVATYVGSLDED